MAFVKSAWTRDAFLKLNKEVLLKKDRDIGKNEEIKEKLDQQTNC